MNHSTRYLTTACSIPIPSSGQHSNPNQVPPTSPACTIDFFELPHCLMTTSERIARENEIDQQNLESPLHREGSVGFLDAIEDRCIGWRYSPIWLFGSSGFKTSLCLQGPRQLTLART